MKRLLTLLVLAPLTLWAGPEKIRPKVKTPTSFAIVVDRGTYGKVRTAVEAYRDAIERDGLATYILVDDWDSPQPVRELLEELHDSREMPLEGAVFIGDIPVPMIRDAQFLTSAFKMDQKRDWQESSVPSDRYYDDFDLRFEYIRADSIEPLYHYFTLVPESAMELCSDIYTARIRPMAREGKDRYEVLEAYLRKAVRLKEEKNPLDDICMARGHGYNSEARDAWAGEQLALREQFPQAFRSGGHVRAYDFDMVWPAKDLYLGAVCRRQADLVLFHHHGSDDTQYLNGYPSGSSADLSKANLQRYLRSRIRSAKDKGKDVQEVMQRLAGDMDVPLSWMQDALEPETLRKDSLFDASMDITLEDIHAIRPNARLVIFDACFNGSFHLEECVADAYIFGEGSTLTAQGNTVNSLQDKWPGEFLGLLACGVRIGQWARHVQYLETHLIGDPTYRFQNTTAGDRDLNPAFTLSETGTSYWEGLLKDPVADVQAMALRKLYEYRTEGLGRLLKETFFTSTYGVVRMECMKLLYALKAPELTEVLQAAAGDSYELVRRLAVLYIGRNGSDRLIPALAGSLTGERASSRVRFQAENAIGMMDLDRLEHEVRLRMEDTEAPGYGPEERQRLLDAIERQRILLRETDSLLTDPRSGGKDLRFAIQRHRNHPAVTTAGSLIRFAKDKTRDRELRLKALEALGWYNRSVKREEILAACRELAATEKDADIAAEARKTVNRLK